MSKKKAAKGKLKYNEGAGFLTASILVILTLIKVKDNTSYSRSAWEVLVQQMMS